MIPAAPPPKPDSTSEKPKRTRRRLRVSCTECTKRRQKCDRQTPCGLCVSRGVSNLCRWEPNPVARPPPARPPIAGISNHSSPRDSNSSTPGDNVEELSARIASLERIVTAQNKLIRQAHLTLPYNNLDFQSQTSLISDDTQNVEPNDEVEHEKRAREPIGQEVQEAAMALAQLSLGNHHGEYFGRGTVVCALHELGHFEKTQLSYSMSTNPTVFCPKTFPVPFSDSTFTVAVRDLVLGIPPRLHTESLFRAFFADVNWRFGIPQEWFEEACKETWKTLSISETGMEINVHWLCLFFAVLALAPQTTNAAPTSSFTTSDSYFLRSLSARRLAKDIYFTTPSFSPMTSAADGTVLGCLATPLLCAYLAEMGRVSEAWKLLGGSIRAAQAVGMHRDPGWQKWKVMSADEGLLRTTGWWGLVVWDRLYSFVLGRPTMIKRDNFDVLPPTSFKPEYPSWQKHYCAFQAELVKLSEVVAEAVEKCLGLDFSTFDTVFEVDRKFAEWEAQIPDRFRWRHWYTVWPEGHILADSGPIAVVRQSYTLNTWYLACRMNLHRSYLTQVTMPPMHNPENRKPNLTGLKRCHEQCINLAIDLLRLQCVTHDSANGQAGRKDNAAWTGNNWAFELCYYLFDAGVTLMSGFSKMPVEPRAQEAQELVQRSIEILEYASREGQEENHIHGAMTKREIALRASEVLNMLGRELGWRRDDLETDVQHPSDLPTENWQAPSPTPSTPNPFGIVPQPALPVSMDATNSTPLSMFFAAPQNGLLLSSFAPQADLSEPQFWSDLQLQNASWDLLE